MLRVYPECWGSIAAGDVVCHGDEKGATEQDRAPCGARDDCACLAILAKETFRPVEDFVSIYVDNGSVVSAPRDRAGLSVDIEDVRRRWKVERGAARTAKQRTPGHRGVKDPGRASTRRGRRIEVTIRRRQKVALEIAHAFLDELFRRLLEVGHRHARKAFPTPGQAYERDRSRTSGWIGVYVRSTGIHDTPVACVRVRTRTPYLDVELPATLSEVDKAYGVQIRRRGATVHTTDAYGANGPKHGSWKTVVRGIGSDGVPWIAAIAVKLLQAREARVTVERSTPPG